MAPTDPSAAPAAPADPPPSASVADTTARDPSHIDWNDPAEVSHWLDKLWHSLLELNGTVCDMLLPPGERQLGPTLHAENYDSAWTQVKYAMAFAGVPVSDAGDEPEPDKLRQSTRADGDSVAKVMNFLRAIFSWKDNDPEADARLRAACPEGLDADKLIARARRFLAASAPAGSSGSAPLAEG
jgi:hypothetical protein